MHASHKRGFTLLEILMVVAAIGILAGITVIAINPTRQLAKARNQTRTADVNTIRNALKEYSLDNQGQVPDGITGKLKNICQSDASSCSTNSDRVNLSVIEQYLAEEALPVDPKKSDGATLTGYQVAVSTQGNYKVTAPKAENKETIAVGPDEVTGYLLTSYPNAAAAYSVRLLREKYTGPALTIRRASDNEDETKDIGFSGIDLDTEAINDFCGTSNCYVKTWHDQSGNDNDATQSTKSAQPKIYDGSSESVIMQNSKVALDFDGSDDYFTLPSGLGDDLVSSQKFSTFLSFNGSGTDTAQSRLISQVDFNGGLFSIKDHNNSDEHVIVLEGSSTKKYKAANAFDAGTTYLNSVIADGSTVSSYRNGSFLVDGSQITYDSTSDNKLTIGGPKESYYGTFHEIIIYDSDQSFNRSDIESNINDYYEIY